MKWYVILGGGLGAAAILTIGLLLGHFAIPKASEPEPSRLQDLSRDIDEALLQQVVEEIDSKQIGEHLRKLTLKPHMATTQGDQDLVDLMLKQWQDEASGLDSAKAEWYHCFLSFPNASQPNSVTVVLQNGTTSFTSRRTEKGDKEQQDPDVVQPYAAYSPPGNPKAMDRQHFVTFMALKRWGTRCRRYRNYKSAVYLFVGQLRKLKFL